MMVVINLTSFVTKQLPLIFVENDEKLDNAVCDRWRENH
jgi:hypothetical protein